MLIREHRIVGLLPGLELAGVGDDEHALTRLGDVIQPGVQNRPGAHGPPGLLGDLSDRALPGVLTAEKIAAILVLAARAAASARERGYKMRQLPLCGRVIFCDWHGVLSRDPFWVSIRGTPTHPLHAQLEAGMAGVFASERGLANEWMTGLLSSDQVIAEMGIRLDRRFRDDFLRRRLDLDCARMRVNAELSEVLRVMRAEAVIAIATDNMDCFARAFHHARHSRRRRAQTWETLADWAVVCDDIICSSDVATLKADDPQAFFGPWLDQHGVGFPDAVLIDDRADNCAAFGACGGTAIRWKMGASDISEVISALKSWFDTAGPAVSRPVRYSF